MPPRALYAYTRGEMLDGWSQSARNEIWASEIVGCAEKKRVEKMIISVSSAHVVVFYKFLLNSGFLCAAMRNNRTSKHTFCLLQSPRVLGLLPSCSCWSHLWNHLLHSQETAIRKHCFLIYIFFVGETQFVLQYILIFLKLRSLAVLVGIRDEKVLPTFSSQSGAPTISENPVALKSRQWSP